MRLVILAALLALSDPLRAQQRLLIPPKDSTVWLDEVTVTGNRLISSQSRNVTVLDAATLRDAPAQSLSEALRYVPGVDVRQRGPVGAQADLSVRGGTFEQTLVMINGIKVSDPQTGHHSLALPLNLNNVERVEVLKGPGARRFGQNAFTGAVNVITRVPDAPAVSVGGYGGSFGAYGVSAAVSAPAGPLRQTFSLSRDAANGHRPNSDYLTQNYFYQAEADALGGTFGLLAGHTDRAFGANDFYSDRFPGQYEEINTSLLSAQYTRQGRRWWWQPRFYWRRNQDEFLLDRDDPEFFRNRHLTHVVGGEANARYSSALGQTGFGAELRREAIASSNLGNHDRLNAGFYAEHQYRNRTFDLTPGVYVNWYSDFGWNAFPGVEAGARLLPNLRLYTNVGTSYRIPTYTDLYYRGPTNVGNPDLQPERALSSEVGVRYLTGGWLLDANVFRREADQLIDWVRPAENDATPWQPQNFYDVTTTGTEVSLGWQAPDATTFVRKVVLSHNYLDSDLLENPEFTSNYVLSHLQHQFITQVDLRLLNLAGGSPAPSGWALDLGLRGRYAERLTDQDFMVFDARLTGRYRTLSVFAEATNLTDADYVEAGFVPMPGRWLRVGFTWDIEY